jgi:NAD+ synthase (glutamine-hydrolysing)
MITNQQQLDHAIVDFKSDCLEGYEGADSFIGELNHYFSYWNINRVVVGISGGIDSAVVLHLLSQCCSLKEIVAVSIFQHDTNEIQLKPFIDKVVDSAKVNAKTLITPHQLNIQSEARNLISSLKLEGSWSAALYHEMTYALRYNIFFTLAAAYSSHEKLDLLGQRQNVTVTMGTTNQDELGYAGWFGRNSDMMVDLQCISGLHKFEVIHLAKELGVDEDIINRVPTGDLPNGSSDEENFGCTYDELSWFTSNIISANNFGTISDFLNPFIRTKFDKLIKLHNKNAHKYQGQGFNPYFLCRQPQVFNHPFSLLPVTGS